MDQILDGLYLGDILGASSKDMLLKLGITHILTVAKDHPPKFPSFFTYKVVKVLDLPSTNLKPKFQQCIEFISDAIEKKGRVFVHCFAGVSRSATIVIAYLMQQHGLPFYAAFKLVKSKRHFINPNDGFRKQLMQFQKELQIRQEMKENIGRQQDHQMITEGKSIETNVKPQMQLSKLIKESLGYQQITHQSNSTSRSPATFQQKHHNFFDSKLNAFNQARNKPYRQILHTQNRPVMATAMMIQNMQHEVEAAAKTKSRGFSLPITNKMALLKANQTEQTTEQATGTNYNNSSQKKPNQGLFTGISRAYHNQGFFESRIIRDNNENILGQAVAQSRFGLPMSISAKSTIYQ